MASLQHAFTQAMKRKRSALDLDDCPSSRRFVGAPAALPALAAAGGGGLPSSELDAMLPVMTNAMETLCTEFLACHVAPLKRRKTMDLASVVADAPVYQHAVIAPLPIALKTQLLGAAGTATPLLYFERALQALEDSRAWRRCKLPLGDSAEDMEDGYVRAADLEVWLAGEAAKWGGDEAARQAFSFLRLVWDKAGSVSVNRSTLNELHRGWDPDSFGGSSGGGGGGVNAVSGGGGGAGGPAAGLLSRRSAVSRLPLDDLLGTLLRRGVLLRRADAAVAATGRGFSTHESYWFGVPDSGRLWPLIKAGRAELLQRLRARKYHEAPRAEVETWKLARSPLPPRFHIRDALGLGTVVEYGTASGAFLRLKE